MYVGNIKTNFYECFKIDKEGNPVEQVEIYEGSRMDRADSVEDEIFYTCDLSLAQGVSDDFNSDACGEKTYNSIQELKYTIDYYSIIKRKSEADDLNLELEQDELSIPADWVKNNIENKMLNDKEFAKWALSIDGLLLEYFSDEIKANFDFISIAIENNPNASKYLDQKLLQSKETIAKLLDINKDLFSQVKINPEFMQDRDFIEECLSKNGNIILVDAFPKDLLNDKQLMTLALINAQDHESLIKDMPDEVKNDINFWLDVLNKNEFYSWGFIYEFLPEIIKNNSNIFKVAIEDDYKLILNAPECFKTKETLSKILRQKLEDESYIDIKIIDMAKIFGDSELNKFIEAAYQKELVEE